MLIVVINLCKPELFIVIISLRLETELGWPDSWPSFFRVAGIEWNPVLAGRMVANRWPEVMGWLWSEGPRVLATACGWAGRDKATGVLLDSGFAGIWGFIR